MIALYTETFEKFLERQGQSQEWQSIIASFGDFPDFVIDEENSNTISFYDAFVQKYEIREIGAETEPLFVHFIKDKLIEAKIKFLPKIKLYYDNFDKLMDRIVRLNKNRELTKTGKIVDDFDTATNNKLYPSVPVVVGSETTPRNASGDTTESTNERSFDNYKEVIDEDTDTRLLIYKSNPELLKMAMELRDIYFECLDSFETCFMGIY